MRRQRADKIDRIMGGPVRRVEVPIDVLLVLLISFVAQATHFSYKQGRAVVSGDSAQYVASAEALTGTDKTPHFEMRKPGYILFLAGVFHSYGNMGYTAVTWNHVFLGLLPLAAYGWGRHLRSRWAGWLAAVLTMARLQNVVWGDRMMSEPLFACLFSFGLLFFVIGLSRDYPHRYMLPVGLLLGLSWLTRGAALPTIVVAFAAILVSMRYDRRRAVASCGLLALPVLFCVVLECGLNLAYAGRFRPSNGTVGATTLLRARHFEGFDLPDTPDAAKVMALLPERGREEAYLADHLDVWVARYHALHEMGMTEWEYDRLMGRVGRSALTDHLGTYVTSSLKLAAYHLLRRTDARTLSPVPENRRTGPLIHPAATNNTERSRDREGAVKPDDWDSTWFAYWGLPHLALDESIELVDRMKLAAASEAPFGGSSIWKALRYWKTKSVSEWSLAALVWLGSVWPGFALLGCVLLGLNRRTCACLAAAYVLDALFIGLLTPTNARLQFIWIVTDTALIAGLVAGLLSIVETKMSGEGRASVRADIRAV